MGAGGIPEVEKRKKECKNAKRRSLSEMEWKITRKHLF
jgi:hypothetical protein